ncbi:MAG: hypothetical protein J5828_01620 [Desulfovibrionaceae bacterium]|nr:hypothetical protein [Desulfovibrionaceae bacterium]
MAYLFMFMWQWALESFWLAAMPLKVKETRTAGGGSAALSKVWHGLHQAEIPRECQAGEKGLGFDSLGKNKFFWTAERFASIIMRFSCAAERLPEFPAEFLGRLKNTIFAGIAGPQENYYGP